MPIVRPAKSGSGLALSLSFASLLCACDGSSRPELRDDRFDRALFRSPPRSVAPHVRWWWPGGAVDDATIRRELQAIAEAGFGGVELQTLSFGLSDADLAADPRVRTVGEPTQLAHVATFLDEAERLGLATSLTLGSGWPSGGSFSTDVRPLELLATRVDVTGPTSVAMPVPTPTAPDWTEPVDFLFPVVGGFAGPFDLVAVLALPVLDGAAEPPVFGAALDVTPSVSAGMLTYDVPAGPHALVFVHRHRVDHLVAGDAFPAAPSAARVVDPLDPTATDRWLTEQSSVWFGAIAPRIPDEVFVDSFELVAELPWSDALAGRFASARGYALASELPFVFRSGGESKYTLLLRGDGGPSYATADERGERVREDYEDLRGELFLESFVDRVASFATDHGTRLRMQAHGGYAHVLDAYARADVPESEGLFAMGSTDFLELASSAAHVTGARTVSSESFVAVSPQGPTLTEGEMWMLAGRAFAAGIDRLVHHGIAYPYQRSNGARWYPFHPDAASAVITAGPFDITNDLRPDEPEFAYFLPFQRALARLSYAMSRGVDRAEVAWLLDEREIPDVGLVRFDVLPPEQGESETSLALRRGGFRYDRISPRMLAASSAGSGALQVGAASYRALVITDWPSANPDELEAVDRALDAGVPVVVLGRLPVRARGYADATARDALVASLRIAVEGQVTTVSTPAALPTALVDAGVVRDVSVRTSTCDTVSLAHRETENGHLVLVFHEQANDCTATLDLRLDGRRASRLDPLTGAEERLPRTDEAVLTLLGQRPTLIFVER